MSECNLIIDSCCDLPYEIIQDADVTLLRFPYLLDGGVFEDDMFATQTAHDFYEAMRKGATPSTSQLSLPLLIDTFTEAAEKGVPTVYLSFTSGLSGSFDLALTAADQVREKYPDFELHVVDTYLASVAEGLLIYEAIMQHKKGLTAAQLAAWAEEARYYVSAQFMVDDLEALRRGGRIPGSVAVAGAALNVKPLLTIDPDGTLSLTGVARGRKKGISSLVDHYKKNVEREGARKPVIIGHADCPKDLERLRDGILKEDPQAFIIEANIGPVIGSHVGPGMLACVVWGTQDKREHLSMADRIARRVKGEK